jgi:EAL domain-containing protein (putative c-di-GMP-specific phosphodiesterase class I)/CheY-like chemotaxis protein
VTQQIAHHSQRGRALIVDDDAQIRKDLSRVLQSLGLAVAAASNGREAAELLKKQSFDVVVSDIDMPEMTGLDLLRTIRQYDLDVPLVLVTGNPGLETATQAVQYGAFRYLTKPVDVESLSQAVKEGVTLHRMAQLKREALEIIGAEGKQLGDRASLDARFNRALDQLWMAQQPIVHWPERKVFAYEALMRSRETTLRGPADLLDAAERLGRLHDLGRCIRAKVAQAALGGPTDVYFFVNLHSRDLADEELYSASAPLSAIAQRVVLEITERASLDDIDGLATKIEQLRKLGFRIAIDDLGAGYAGLTSFTQLEPDFAKLDMSLVRDVHLSERKQSVIRAMNTLCQKDLSVSVVTEGVETVAERDALARLGCDLLQGYLFAKPSEGFVAPNWG